MRIDQIKPKNQPRSKKRIGRGGKRGTYSGKGQKGQRSRAGRKIRSEQKEAILKIPKVRGINFKNSPKKNQPKIFAVNLDLLEKKFVNGNLITLKALVSKGLINRVSGRYPKVKILSHAKIFSKKLHFSGLDVSVKAKELIEKAGGSVK